MSAIPLIDHSLAELAELGLLHESATAPLASAALTTTSTILAHFQQHHSFASIEGLTESQRHLARLSTAFLNLMSGKFTSAHLYDDTVRNQSALFIPGAIDWPKVTGYKRDFLDTWITQRIAGYAAGKSQHFINVYLGELKDAEDFYHKAILHPLRPDGLSVRGSGYEGHITYVIKLFLRLHQATVLLDDPIDLLKCWAWNEYGMAYDNEHLRRIIELYKGDAFPFAYATYKMDMSSPYFNYPRRMQQINRMRYVSLFNKAPYGYGNLDYLPEMTPERFAADQEAANTHAELDCRSIIHCLKALGFPNDYRALKGWNEEQLSIELVDAIARREDLARHELPARYYAFLLNELYGTRFDPEEPFTARGPKRA